MGTITAIDLPLDQHYIQNLRRSKTLNCSHLGMQVAI